jgi:hypothetical protein
MSNRKQRRTRAIEASASHEPEELESTRQQPLDLLQSEAARDMIWYHRRRAGEMGFKASDPEPKTRSSSHADRTTRNDRHLKAVVEERRINQGLFHLSRFHRETLRIAYEAKRRDPQLHAVLGEFADLAMRTGEAELLYGSYVEHFQPKEGADHPLTMETWVIVGNGKPFVEKIRKALELVLRPALDAYEAHRVRPVAIYKCSNEDCDHVRRPVPVPLTDERPIGCERCGGPMRHEDQEQAKPLPVRRPRAARDMSTYIANLLDPPTYRPVVPST